MYHAAKWLCENIELPLLFCERNMVEWDEYGVAVFIRYSGIPGMRRRLDVFASKVYWLRRRLTK